MVTPWPWQRTGIADYAFDLVHGLAEAGKRVDVFTNCPVNERRTCSHENIRLFDIAEFAERFHGSQIVYQMGNNSNYHLEMFDLMFDYPGVVHLHDPSLHHLIAYLFYHKLTIDQYYRVINYWYGFQAVKLVRDWMRLKHELFWESAYVGEVPLIEPALEHARGVIVHSQFAKQRVLRRLAHIPTYTIPQLYRDMPVHDSIRRDQSRLIIGAFGVAQKSKQIDTVMQSVSEVNDWFVSKQDDRRVELWVVGELDSCSTHLPELAQRLGPNCIARFFGRQSECEFLQAMRQVDLCVSLRFPTMGETSAVVSRALQLGLPTIVNNVGWYAELPDCVRKIEPQGDTQKALVELIKSCFEKSYFDTWQQDCIANSQTSYSFSATIEEYIRILDSSR